jgi:WS/DGAT/MGAT family acyltransferase
VPDPHFDRSYHLRHVSLPAPGGTRELLDLAAQLFATPLDRERALWEAYCIEGVEGEGAAYFMKMHHSLVDGVGSVAILDALTQKTADAPAPRMTRPRRPRRASPPAGVPAQLARLAADNARGALELLRGAAGASARALREPGATARELVRTARGLRGLLADLTAPLVRDPLAEGSPGISRRLDVMDLPIERLRKIKAPLGVTLNDVVLAALASTLRAYHRERRTHVERLNCMVPMNLRGRGEREALGNRVGTFNIVLPLGEARPERRLERIVEQTRAAKSDKRGAAMPFLAEGMRWLPGGALRFIARRNLGRYNVACTNVPGVAERRYLAGARVDAIYPFASPVEGTPLVMALLSYAGALHVGIDTDPEAIPDPHRIAELFEAGLAELEALGAAGTPD